MGTINSFSFHVVEDQPAYLEFQTLLLQAKPVTEVALLPYRWVWARQANRKHTVSLPVLKDMR